MPKRGLPLPDVWCKAGILMTLILRQSISQQFKPHFLSSFSISRYLIAEKKERNKRKKKERKK